MSENHAVDKCLPKGMLVADRWIEKVLDVNHVSERLRVVRVIVGKSVLNLISVYAPQTGRSMVEKEEFLAMLEEVVSRIDSGERLLICGDLNGHVGSEIDGFAWGLWLWEAECGG